MAVYYFICSFSCHVGSVSSTYQSYLVLLLSIILLFLLITTFAKRVMPERLSNGDDNKIQLNVKILFPFSTDIEIIDELPGNFRSEILKKLSV